ncbi:nucleotidyl transferase AbiEii/AbiGii toxin family protein [Candidatus Woesearchaeota archaeon]|nr:nucleotidyl transferase AbiEii/AbiGii toxin family protein [Candidatus Woesearchaeota archaeon]
MIPLLLRLKKASHKEIAKAQDMIIQTLYEVFDHAVFHGGTCIWRCYQGKRFSEDIDVYLPKENTKIDVLFEHLKKKGFMLEKKKMGEKSLYSRLLFNRTSLRLEAVFKNVSGTLQDYETIEGNFITVYALTAEELIIEKVSAYQNRRKIRDLYDVFFLLRYVHDFEKIKKSLYELLYTFQNPVDEKDLKILILEGIAPETTKMIEYIREKYGKN